MLVDIVCILETALRIPGPLTLRMMERVVSSMNSTRTWVTPPREPAILSDLPFPSFLLIPGCKYRTSAAENAGDLDELDGDPTTHSVSLQYSHHRALSQQPTWRNPFLRYVIISLTGLGYASVVWLAVASGLAGGAGEVVSHFCELLAQSARQDFALCVEVQDLRRKVFPRSSRAICDIPR